MRFFAILIRVCALAFFVSSPPTSAIESLEAANKAGKELLDRWRPSAPEKNKKLLPNDFPPHWRGKFIHDSIFECDVFIAETGAATKPVIFLIHGLGQNGAKDWLHVVPALEAAYHVFLLDLPGFGYSDKPAKKLSPTAYAQLLHRLKQQLAPQIPIAVVGHSMGGAVSLRYADLYPRDIAQLVLVDAAGILQRTAFVKHSAESQVDLDLDALPNSLLGYAVNVQDFGSGLVEKLLKVPDPTSLLTHSETAWGMTLAKVPNINSALALIEEDFSHAVLTSRVKTSIIWGEKDTVAPLRTGHVLAHYLSGNRLNIISGAQHTPMITHATEFNLLLQNLLLTPINKPSTEPAPAAILDEAECANADGTTISGRYRVIKVKRCKGLLIVDTTAENIIIEESLVTMQSVRVTAKKGAALQVRDSVVVATNTQLTGDPAVDSTHSRLDFAGAVLSSARELFWGRSKNRLILSVSEGILDGERHYLHGDYQLLNQRLEDVAWRIKP